MPRNSGGTRREGRASTMHRSGMQVMLRLVGLTRPLAGQMAISVACGVVGFVCATAIPVLGVAEALGIAEVGSVPIPTAWAPLVLLALAVARGVLHYIEQNRNHFIAFKLLAHVRDLVFGALRRLAPAKLAGADRGALVSTVTADVELLEVFYAHTISPILIAVITCAGMAAFMGLRHPAFALVACMAYLAVGVVLPLVASRTSGDAGRRMRDGAAHLSGTVLQSLRGLRELLQYDAGTSRLAAMDSESRRLAGTQWEVRRIAGESAAWATASVIGFSLVQLMVAMRLVAAGSVEPAAAIVAVVTLFSSFGPVLALANLGTTLQGTLAAGDRVLDILDEEPQVRETEDGTEVAFEGITADDVTFSYPGAPGQLVVDHASVSVAPGEVVGICGRSGSGKSTLCRLMMRFWDVDGGAVRISDTDVRQLPTSNLRSLEALVEQDTHLFHDSIRENLRIARPDATDEQIEAACRAASAHDFVTSLPQGYDTMVGELGDTLSGGERQRLGLARAFLHDAPLLLLDEPTSNVDALNEGQILRSIERERGSRAVVLVSHRASTMAIADRVCSMDTGRLS